MSAFTAWGRAALFAFAAAAAALSPSAYTARTRALAMRHIYFNAWHVLPRFTLFMSLASLVVIAITITLAREYGLAQFALELVFRAVVLELIPLLTAFYVALRSGAAIVTEVAMMRVSGELDHLLEAHVDPYEREFVPRIAAAAVSVFALTIVSCTVVMFIAYLVTYGANPSGFAEYSRTVARVFGPGALAGPGAEVLRLRRGGGGDPDRRRTGCDARSRIGAARRDGRHGAAFRRPRLHRARSRWR